MSEQIQLVNISVFDGPVSNTIRKRDVDWLGFAQMLVDKPQFLSDNTNEQKSKGPYFVRGQTNGNRDDEHLLECTLAVLDVDKTIDGHPLPFPSEIHDALSDVQHGVHATATPGRCRIIFRVKPYQKEQTAQVTKAAYEFCRSRGLNFALSNESKTKSQPFFLPQTTAFCQHQAFAKTDGTLFDYESCPKPENEPERENQEPGHNHLEEFIEELKTGTIHQAVKTYAGWQHRTSNLTSRQIFDDISVLINSSCTDHQKVERWHKNERVELENWFSANVEFKEPPATGTETTDPEELLSAFEVRREYVENLGKEQFLYPKLIIRQHIVTIIGMSGSGKTTYAYYEVARLLAKMELKVWYIDADSPASEHKRMKEFADTHGFKFLNPDVNVGTSVKKLIDMLKSLADKQSDLTDYVFFFDTLKKFADLMSKTSVKDFYVLARRLTKRGATIVLLGHANKYRDKSGNLIFEGVGDVKADGDDLIFLEAAPGALDGIDVTTVVDITRGAKVRGIFEPFSFNISSNREISFHDKVIGVASPDERRVPDLDILEAAKAYLTECLEPVATTQFVQYVSDSTGVGLKRVRELIIKHSALKGSEHGPWRMFNYTVGKKNIHLYELPDQGAK